MRDGYASMWAFQVPADLRAEFERRYGPEGSWAELFGRAAGYVETILLKDQSNAGRYVTVDRWRDEQAFLAFHSSFSRPYERLDRECARLTTDEQLLGVFIECGA